MNARHRRCVFLRFPLGRGMVDRVNAGAGLAMGVDHPECRYRLSLVSDVARRSLCEDLET